MRAAEVYDVAVVGGGSAGIAAAIAAATSGARTLLVERATQLGGNASQAGVHTICGLYRDAGEGDSIASNPGFAVFFSEGLAKAGGAGAPVRAGRVWYLPTDPDVFGRHALEQCSAVPELECRLACVASRVTPPRDSHPAWQLELQDGGGVSQAEARLLIDTSGDANAAALAGAETACEPGERLQTPSFIFRIDDVAPDAIADFARVQLVHGLASAVRRGELVEGEDAVVVREGIAPGEVWVTLNVARPDAADFAPLDDSQRVALESRARKSAEAIADHLQRQRPGFEQSRVGRWPTRLGIRETRRVCGRVELSRDDVLEGRLRDDEIARSSWPIELWKDHRRARFEYPRGSASIPLGALVSREQPRLGMAGRCLSASHEALGAVRVIGTALATGEAIGVAAALAAAQGVGLDEIAPSAVREAVVAREYPADS